MATKFDYAYHANDLPDITKSNTGQEPGDEIEMFADDTSESCYQKPLINLHVSCSNNLIVYMNGQH